MRFDMAFAGSPVIIAGVAWPPEIADAIVRHLGSQSPCCLFVAVITTPRHIATLVPSVLVSRKNQVGHLILNRLTVFI